MCKKLLSIVIVALLLLGVCACGDLDDMTGGKLDGSVGSPSKNEVVVSFFEELQQNETMPFELTEKAKKTLAEKENMFIGNKNDGLSEMVDSSLEYKVLTKNIDKHGDKLIHLEEAYVLSIDETELNEETTLTEFHLLDANENSYYCLSLSAYEDIFAEDIVGVYALPIGETSFENVSGGTTLAVMLAGCYIEKVQ